MIDHSLTQLEEDLAGDVSRIAKRLKRFGGTPLVTVVVRPPKGSGERDVILTTDQPEAVIAAIRKMTGRESGMAAMSAADAAGSDRPPEPTTVEEARSEAMGLLLAVIDTANALVPPPGTSAASAMAQWSVMVESAAFDLYGESWSEFVQHVRRMN